MPIRRIAFVLAWAAINSFAIAWWEHSFEWRLLGTLPEAIMGWLVLYLVAGVAWPWIPAYVGGRYAFNMAFSFTYNMFPDLQGISWFSTALTTLIAIPATGVLCWYTPRGVLWLIMPAAGRSIALAIAELFGQDHFLMMTGELPVGLMLVSFGVGLLEGALLLYILEAQITARENAPRAAPALPSE